MITGPSGFAIKFGTEYDDDVLTEYFSTISTINGITYTEGNDLIYYFTLDNESCPLLIFSDSECIVPTKRIESFLYDHGRFPFEANELFSDINVENDRIPVPQTATDFDETILAIYRFLHAIQ